MRKTEQSAAKLGFMHVSIRWIVSIITVLTQVCIMR